MLRSAAVLALAVLAACYEPAYDEGIACGPDRTCPPGMSCAGDGTCRRGAGAEDGAPGGGTVTDSGGASAPADAALPDAAPVGCGGDGDCLTPPTRCQLPGTCDPRSHTCQFPALDCTSLDGECTRGACEEASGTCAAQPINQDASCGSDSCGPFGACTADGDTCDESGTQTRTCTVNTCQAGACVAASRADTAACLLETDGINCGPPTVTDCTACDYASRCDELAAQTCICSTFTCAAGSCTATPISCVQACERDTDGNSCPNGFCEEGVCRREPCPLCATGAAGER
jgi:hypothetical protein